LHSRPQSREAAKFPIAGEARYSGVPGMTDAIHNFRRLDERLATAGQPGDAQFRALAAAGCEAVINLHVNDPRWALPGEEALLAELGVDYHHLPVEFDAPGLGDYRRFEKLMDALGRRSTLVHCVANYRASCFCALYAERRLDWSRAQGDAFIVDVWQPDAIWRSFLDAVRKQPPTGFPT
jgi:protein tyrosine phosphatase (PTP) superfamily phosphohydrolase (DUF442 family)